MGRDNVDELEAEALDQLEATEDAEAPEGTAPLAAACRRRTLRDVGKLLS